MPKIQRVVLLIILSVLIVFSSCRKDKFITDNSAKLEFSTDTVFFDTIFSSLGSSYHILRVLNPHKESIKISSLRLMGGENSQYRINVDGESGVYFENIEVKEKDSIYIFIEVTIDPQDLSLPYVISDSIVFETNGNIQDVKLVSWGQDAYYYRPSRQVSGLPQFSSIAEYKKEVFINDEIIWKADKPHVIYGYLMIDSSLTLKMEPGTQVYLHKNAGLWIYKGASLVCEGEVGNEVVFQGDRREDYFQELPGQWDRIWINESHKNSSFKNTIIKNGFVGIQAESLPFTDDPKKTTNSIVMENSIIENMVGVGLYCRNYNVEAKNSLFSNTGTSCIALTGGGNYSFTHCTVANYWSGGHRKDESVVITNYYESIYGDYIVNDLNNAYFGNCIIYGTNENEVKVDFDSDKLSSYLFDNCIINQKDELDSTFFMNYLKVDQNISWEGTTRNSLFNDVSENDFSLFEGSLAKDKADPTITGNLTVDILGNIRDNNPDIGAYEWLPE